MSEIKLLSTSMINKIAAGEVIERPASVVKELMENALDAGATRIELEIERSGSDLIRITDNGSGIASGQLRLALSPHATSKIATDTDLFRINTLGFRGEALASIAEISQMILRSRTGDSPEGAELKCNGGEFTEVVPCGMPVGTVIEVRNIFFNVPARRKFLKSPQTEFGHISDAFNRLALPYFGTHVVLKHNGRTVFDLSPTGDLRDRIRQLFGEETASRLIPVHYERGEIRISGYVGHPDFNRSNSGLQYFFLNNRFIRDRSLQHALTESYRGLIPIGRFPVAFLNVGLPSDFVDVNVHPTKLEVRFSNSSLVYSGFLGAIREEFLRSDLNSHPQCHEVTSRQGPERNDAPDDLRNTDFSDPFDPQSAMSNTVAQQKRDEFNRWAAARQKDSFPENPPSGSEDTFPQLQNIKDTKEPFPRSGHSGGSTFTLSALTRRVPEFQPFPKIGGGSVLGTESFTSSESPSFQHGDSRLNAPFSGAEKGNSFRDLPETEKQPSGLSDVGNMSGPVNQADSVDTVDKRYPPGRQVAYNSQGKPVIQIHDRYLVMETGEGLAIIDQHALHERILYEKLRVRMDSGHLESQQLLVPEAIDLTPSEFACVMDNRDFLKDLGLLADAFGGNTVLISGYPVLLANLTPGEILYTLINPILEGGRKPDKLDLIDDMLHQMACKAAVKAGDFLHSDSIRELLALAEQEINSHHCPHGRPSTLVFTCAEIDKLFCRT